MLTGGCFCRRVRYEADATPFNETVCHCTICRGTTGTPMVAWFTVPRAKFRFVTDMPARFQSSDRAARTFCPNCGTQLTFESDDYADETDVTIVSLDDPNALPPRDHSWTQSRLRWVHLGDGLPQFARSRGDG